MNQTAATGNLPESFELSDLRKIEGLVDENPEVLTVSVLKWQLRHRHENGLGAYCVSIGKNILISKTGYERWLAQQAGKVITRRRRAGAY